jgi:N-acetylglutamate synthase-like GNAT family acetyltransferase
MKQGEIFKRMDTTVLMLGRAGGFKVIDGVNKVLVTNFPSSSFNCVSFGELADSLVDEFKAAKISFTCWPQDKILKDFPEFCARHGLVKAYEALAHEFSDLISWDYQTNFPVQVKKIVNVQHLSYFDDISSIVYNYPKGITYELLKNALTHPELEFFLIYAHDQPVGCAMISFAEAVAEINWLAVLPQYRNQGLATELTKYCMHYIKQKNYQHIVTQNLPMSQNLFQSLGFKSVGLPVPFYSCLG